MEGPNKPEQLRKELIEIIVLAEQENWERVDEILKEKSNEPDFIKWAQSNINNRNLNLADLAASIMEASDKELDPEDQPKLVASMRSYNQENPYASFRATCVLAKKGDFEVIPVELKDEIISKLEEFLNDEDEEVVNIAINYIQSLK